MADKFMRATSSFATMIAFAIATANNSPLLFFMGWVSFGAVIFCIWSKPA